MTPNSNIAPAPQRAPVSTLERLIPWLSFGLAAISGAVGAMMMQKFFSSLRNAETAGFDALYIGLARIDAVIGSLLTAAVLTGGIGLLVCLIRMFSKNAKSSPPGILFFLIGSLGLMPSFLMGVGVYMLLRWVSGPAVPNISSVAAILSILAISSIVVACILIVVLGAFSFISFSARLGRKYSPFLFLLLIEMEEIFAAVAFFSVVQYCVSQTNASFWR